jgi:hypothetical protein
MPLKAGAGRWSWGICGVRPAVFPQVAHQIFWSPWSGCDRQGEEG